MKQVTVTFFLVMLTALLSAQPFDFESEVTGTVGTFASGWVGSPTTDFRWEADSNGTGSPDTGPAFDHTLGTGSGMYIYTEASAPAASGDEATFTSPVLDVSAFTNPGLEFWYHRFGADMGDLFIEIDDNGTWVALDSIIGPTQGSEIDPWLRRVVFLGGYGDSVQIRFRAVCGAGFTGDMAIDDVSLVEVPAFDARLRDVASNVTILQYPAQQVPSTSPALYAALVSNAGADTLTNVDVILTAGSYADTVSLPSLTPLQGATVQFPDPLPLTMGSNLAIITVESDQTDDNPADNVDTLAAPVVSDTVYARDDSFFTGSLGIGPGTPGVLGQNFEILNQDTLTSVSFFLTDPPIGQQIYVDIYTFSGTPQTVIASSDTTLISGPGWYTLAVCPTALEPGTYFLGVAETVDNITLANNTNYFEPNAGWVIFDTNPWQPSEFYGFTVSYLLRANFGSYISLDLGEDLTVCADDSVTLTVPAPFSSPLWFGQFDQDSLVVQPPNQVFVTATALNGCPYTDTLDIFEAPLPVAGMGSDSTVDDTAAIIDLNALLSMDADTGGSWVDTAATGGLTGSDFDPTAVDPGMYTLFYISRNDCGSDTAEVMISVELTVGIRQQTALGLELYPNPNQGQFTLRFGTQTVSDKHLRLFDQTGREVYRETVNGAVSTHELRVTELPKGIYLLRVQAGNQQGQQQVIIR